MMKMVMYCDRSGAPAKLRRAFQLTTLLLFVASLPILGVSEAKATLNEAHDYYMQVQGSYCWGKVKEFGQSAEKREDYQSVENLGNECTNQLEDMLDEVNNIGASFSDDKNRSWASDVKRDMISATQAALEGAKQVKEAARRKTNSKKELEKLNELLDELSKEFWKLNDEHRERLRELAEDVDDIGRKWLEEAKDDLPAYEEAVKEAAQLRGELADLYENSYEQSKGNMDVIEDALDAWGDGTRDDIGDAYREMFVMQKRAKDIEDEIADKIRDYRQAIENRDREWERFVSEAKESTALLTNDVAATVDRMGEFGREYYPF